MGSEARATLFSHMTILTILLLCTGCLNQSTTQPKAIQKNTLTISIAPLNLTSSRKPVVATPSPFESSTPTPIASPSITNIPEPPVSKQPQPTSFEVILELELLPIDTLITDVYTADFGFTVNGNIVIFDVIEFRHPNPQMNDHVWDVAIADNLAIVLNNSYVEIIDVADPMNATLLAKISLPELDIYSQIEIINDFILVNTLGGLWVFDIGNPINPKQVGHYSNFQAHHMHILDEWVYLVWAICGWESVEGDKPSGGCGYGIDVLDISDPTQPRQIGIVRLEAETNQSFIESTKLIDEYIFFQIGPSWYKLDPSFLKKN